MTLAKVFAPILAATMLGTGALGTVAFADTTPTTAAAPVATDHTFQRAIDALRDVLDRMVDNGLMTATQRDAVADAAKAVVDHAVEDVAEGVDRALEGVVGRDR